MEISYSCGPAGIPLLGETIGANFERTVARVPDGEALVSRHQGLRYTYAELDEAVDVVARGLLDLGLVPGERLGIWSPNNTEWVLVQYATAKIGVILVNINPAYRTSELEYALNQSGCRILIAAPSFKTSDYVSMVAEVHPNVPDARAGHLLRVTRVGRPARPRVAGARRRAPHPLGRPRLRRRRSTSSTRAARPASRRAPRSRTTTSSTTASSSARAAATPTRDRVCIPVPFYHCFGMVLGNLACTTHGATIVLPEAAFEAGAVLETVEAERCTSLYGVPTMFIAELEHPDFQRFDLSSLRTGIMAGSPCPVEVMKQAVSAMHMEEVTICYGMTETSPVSTQTAAADSLDKRVSTVGRVHPHVEVKIVDP